MALIVITNEIAPPGFEPGSEDVFDGNRKTAEILISITKIPYA